MRKVVVALLVLAVVVVVADVGGRMYAQQQVAKGFAQHTAGQVEPAVEIHGFSFLLQALPGRYSHVSLRSDDLAMGSLRNVAARADLYDIAYPLRDALGGTVDGMTIGRAHLRLTIPAAVLGSALGVPDLALSAAGGDGIVLHTSVTVAGESIPVDVRVAVGLSGRTLRVAAAPVAAAGVALPPALAHELRQRLTASVPLRELPFGATSATASVSGGDLVISASAAHLTADQLRPAA